MLKDIVVLDLSRILAGPYCTMTLADLGAEVIKVEWVQGGDQTRSWGPPFADDGRSAYFLSTNRGKRSIAIDLNQPDGQAMVRELAGRVLVLVENFLAGQLEVWGLGLRELRAANRVLITVGSVDLAIAALAHNKGGMTLSSRRCRA